MENEEASVVQQKLESSIQTLQLTELTQISLSFSLSPSLFFVSYHTNDTNYKSRVSSFHFSNCFILNVSCSIYSLKLYNPTLSSIINHISMLQEFRFRSYKTYLYVFIRRGSEFHSRISNSTYEILFG